MKFLSISNLNFAGYTDTDSKNQVRNIQKNLVQIKMGSIMSKTSEIDVLGTPKHFGNGSNDEIQC